MKSSPYHCSTTRGRTWVNLNQTITGAAILYLYTDAMMRHLTVEQWKIPTSKQIKCSLNYQGDFTNNTPQSPLPTQQITSPAMLSTAIAWTPIPWILHHQITLCPGRNMIHLTNTVRNLTLFVNWLHY